MTVKEFVEKYYPYAKSCEETTGLSAIATLTQAALETGWGAHAPGNMFFGIKANKGWTGKKQLLVTTEVFKDDKQGGRFPEVISIKPRKDGKFLYNVKDWFRAYDSPYDSFMDRYEFFVKNTRYKYALDVRGNYERFFEEIHKAGYATGPNYSNTLKEVAKKIIEYAPI